MRRLLAKHGFDEGGLAIDIGAHHDDIVRLQTCILLQQGEQLIVQHLQLAQLAVTTDDLDRVIRLGRRLSGGRRQQQNIALQLLQQRIAFDIDKGVVFFTGKTKLVKLVDVIAPLLAERGQQFIDHQRRFAAAQLFLAAFQIAPVMRAGVVVEQVNIDMLAERRQHIQIQRRHCRDGEDENARRQPGLIGPARLQMIDQAFDQVGAMRLVIARAQQAP